MKKSIGIFKKTLPIATKMGKISQIGGNCEVPFSFEHLFVFADDDAPRHWPLAISCR